MTNIELYISPGACSRVPLIALEEAGADFTARAILLKHGQHQAPEYLQLNPKGKVPLLVMDGQALSENVAILTALSRRFPEVALLPTGAGLASDQALSMLAWCASGLHPLVTRVCMPQVITDENSAWPRIRTVAGGALKLQLAIAERALERSLWLLGNWSIVDAYLFWIWIRLQDAPINLAEFPQLAAHALRMHQRPAVQRALAREAAATSIHTPQENP